MESPDAEYMSDASGSGGCGAFEGVSGCRFNGSLAVCN